MSATFDQIPGVTHPIPADAPDRFISITKARCIARYRMHTIPGRPEELQTNAVVLVGMASVENGANYAHRVISLAYSGGEMRIRQHGGMGNREWTDVRDFRLRDGWLSEVYEYLDQFLGYVSQAKLATPATIRPHRSVDSTHIHPVHENGQPLRPIRDNPQA